MRDVALPGTGRTTSRLGFGGSQLGAGPALGRSLRLLDAAFDAGIRHFDVAPLYGSGGAEVALGAFLRARRQAVTVTTKFGLFPPPGRTVLQAAKTLLRPLVRRIPGLQSGLRGATRLITPAPNYTPAALLASLHRSLRLLGCDSIDLFLLHEADAGDLSGELVRMLDQAVAEGRIGAWGIGSSRDKIDRILGSAARAPAVLQFEWSVLSRDPPRYENSFVITHQALSHAFARLKAMLSDQRRRKTWSERVGAELADDRVLSRLLLAAALVENPGGLVLFSTRHPHRIAENLSALALVGDASVARFAALARAERDTPPTQ